MDQINKLTFEYITMANNRGNNDQMQVLDILGCSCKCSLLASPQFHSVFSKQTKKCYSSIWDSSSGPDTIWPTSANGHKSIIQM